MASPPGLAFKTLRVWMHVCVCVCVNDEFCADDGSECREVKENRVSREKEKTVS